MAVEQEISHILEGAVPDTSEDGAKIVTQAMIEVTKLLEISSASMLTFHQKQP